MRKFEILEIILRERERKKRMIKKKRKGNTVIDKTYRHLSRVKSINDMINTKQQEIDNLRSIAEGTALCPESERVQSSRSKDKLGDCCAKIADLCAEINQDINTYVDYRADVIHSIDLLEDLEERTILCRRYLQFMEYSEIAHELEMSQSTVYRIHRDAIRNLSDILYKNG